ncbi:DUF2795 domain-containing protein [Streptomyces sp. DSM 44915]|uniref:DUF2795 domain-containing protein n=1 Tax=Streptomyces chisholmiae TaxID=3075540 RepID=A0ABU2JJH8_9ACTN|nr:DUF2795 domain-containing protein [Streptomyces sp. DSM 44915]MDT0264883.1 DUF2795 domain-containing protein [Streptomyces sp. DSM 44915]
MQQRGSDQYSPRRDDEMKHELQGMLRGERPSRAEEWRDPEPAADDDPQLAGGPVRPGAGGAEREQDDEAFRFELARYLRRTDFPADRPELLAALDENHAPEPLVETVRADLPPEHAYQNVQEVAVALGHHPRA